MAATLAPVIPLRRERPMVESTVVADCTHRTPKSQLWAMACGAVLCWDCGVDHQRHADCPECDDYIAAWGE